MDQTWEVFARLKDQLVNCIHPLGFILAKDVKDDAFGSHYVELLKEEKGIMLIWDGKDAEFALAINRNIHKDPYKGWIRIANEQVPRLPWDEPIIDRVLTSIGAVIEALEFQNE